MIFHLWNMYDTHNKYSAITSANQWICKSAKAKPHLQEYSLLGGIREIHGIILLSIIFFKHLTNTASDTSVLNPSPYIWFQMRAPRYLIPVFPKSDLTAGMCRWQAALVLWSWISLFSWKNVTNIFGILPVWYLNMKRPIKYLFISWNFIILSLLYKGWELILDFHIFWSTCDILMILVSNVMFLGSRNLNMVSKWQS